MTISDLEWKLKTESRTDNPGEILELLKQAANANPEYADANRAFNIFHHLETAAHVLLYAIETDDQFLPTDLELLSRILSGLNWFSTLKLEQKYTLAKFAVSNGVDINQVYDTDLLVMLAPEFFDKIESVYTKADCLYKMIIAGSITDAQLLIKNTTTYLQELLERLIRKTYSDSLKLEQKYTLAKFAISNGADINQVYDTDLLGMLAPEFFDKIESVYTKADCLYKMIIAGSVTDAQLLIKNTPASSQTLFNQLIYKTYPETAIATRDEVFNTLVQQGAVADCSLSLLDRFEEGGNASKWFPQNDLYGYSGGNCPGGLLYSVLHRNNTKNAISFIETFIPDIDSVVTTVAFDVSGSETINEIATYLIGRGATIHVSKEGSYPFLNALFIHKETLLSRADKPFSPTQLLKTTIKCLAFSSKTELKDKAKELIKFALDKGAELHQHGASDDYDPDTFSAFENLFVQNQLDLLDTHPNVHIRPTVFLTAFSENFGIGFIINFMTNFEMQFDMEEIYNFLRANGASIAQVSLLKDIHDIANDYIKTLSDTPLLSTEEMCLLDGKNLSIPIEEYHTISLLNPYGFTPLHFALLSGNFGLARSFISQELYSVTQPNFNGVTGIALLEINENRGQELEAHQLTQVALEHIDDVDMPLNSNGDTIAYSFSTHNQELILKKSHDPLFYFLQETRLGVLDATKINVGITHGEGFWSTGAWSFANVFAKNNPQFQFYLVNITMLESGGAAFAQWFSGWMNPGGGDDYPGDREFSLQDWQTSMQLIKTYHLALKLTTELSIPTIGMCGGAQNLALFSHGNLYSLDGYSSGKHTIVFLEGSLAHFMALGANEQRAALEHCEFSPVIIKGDTAHHFAASTYKLGKLELGAISAEDGVAMAYSNGLHFATQFHPEHYYFSKNATAEKNWFCSIGCLMQARHDGYYTEVIDSIKVRLEQCANNIYPQCMEDYSYGLLDKFLSCHSECL